MTNNNTGISPSTPSFPPSRTSEHKNAAATNKDRLNELDDKRIVEIKPLIPPQILVEGKCLPKWVVEYKCLIFYKRPLLEN